MESLSGNIPCQVLPETARLESAGETRQAGGGQQVPSPAVSSQTELSLLEVRGGLTLIGREVHNITIASSFMP